LDFRRLTFSRWERRESLQSLVDARGINEVRAWIDPEWAAVSQSPAGGKSNNPFVPLLGEFRSTAANLNTAGFAVCPWWGRERFAESERRDLGCCHLPVRYEGKAEYQEFMLTVSVAGEHAECGPVFADLASRAGAALPSAIRSELADHCPPYITEKAPWWFPFLWRVGYGDVAVERPISETTGKPVDSPAAPWLLERPFLRSIEAIELCRVHTDEPVFPPRAATPEGGEGVYPVQ